MAPPRKSASQVAAATSKGKLTLAGSTGPTDAHLPHLSVHIEDIGKEHSSSTTAPEEGINGRDTGLPAEGQLLQMLAGLQRQLDEQRAEAA